MKHYQSYNHCVSVTSLLLIWKENSYITFNNVTYIFWDLNFFPYKINEQTISAVHKTGNSESLWVFDIFCILKN